MTVANTVRSVFYVASGTGPYAVPFQFFELAVFIDGVALPPEATIIAQTSPGLTGSVSFVTAPPAGARIAITGNTVATQQTQYPANQPFPTDTLEKALDRLTMVDQEHAAQIIAASDALDAVRSDIANVADDVAGATGQPTKQTYALNLTALIAKLPNAAPTIEMGYRSSVSDGAGGHFNWLAGDQSTRVASDPLQGVYVAPASAPTGVSGCWERVRQNVVNARWFGAVPSVNAGDQTAIINAALQLIPANGGLLQIDDGTRFNLNNLVFPARCDMSYRLDDDVSSPSPQGDIGSSERAVFRANSSYPADPSGGIVNETRITSSFHPGLILDVRKDVAGHDAFLAPGQSRTDPVRASYLIHDEQTDALLMQYINYPRRDPFSSFNIALFQRQVLLGGVGNAQWPVVPAVGTVITGETSGAKGYVLGVQPSPARTTVMWIAGRFVAGERIKYGATTSSVVVATVAFFSTPYNSLSQSLDTGNWCVGLPPGAVGDEFAVGGLVAAAPTRNMGQALQRTVLEPGFAWVDNYEAGTPTGFNVVLDATTSDPTKRRLYVRKRYSDTNEAVVGALRAGVEFNNTLLKSLSAFNVSTLTKSATGVYRITFTNPFPRVDYLVGFATASPTDKPVFYDKQVGYLEFKNYNAAGTALQDLTGYVNVTCMLGDI